MKKPLVSGFDMQGAQRDPIVDIATCTAALVSDQDNTEAYYDRAVARYHLGDYSLAVNDCSEAIRLQADHGRAFTLRALAQLDQGEYLRAYSDAVKAVELLPTSGEAYNTRGMTRYRLGEIAGAKEDFDEALRRMPGFALAYNNRATCRLELGDLPGALCDCDEANRIDPRLIEPYTIRGSVYLLLENVDAASQQFEMAISINPRLCWPIILRGNASYHANRIDDMLKDYQTAFVMNPTVTIRFIAGVIAQNVENNAELAIESCNEHIRRNVNDVASYARRGLSLLLLQQDAAAEPDLIFVRKSWPHYGLYFDQLMEAVIRHRGRIAMSDDNAKQKLEQQNVDRVFMRMWEHGEAHFNGDKIQDSNRSLRNSSILDRQ